MIVKGRNRDTAWFSMIDGDWPAREGGLRGVAAARRISTSAGAQKRGLACFQSLSTTRRTGRMDRLKGKRAS